MGSRLSKLINIQSLLAFAAFAALSSSCEKSSDEETSEVLESVSIATGGQIQSSGQVQSSGQIQSFGQSSPLKQSSICIPEIITEIEYVNVVDTSNTSGEVFGGIDSISDVASTSFTLNWTDNSNIALYLIFDMTSGLPVFLKSVPAPATNAVVTGLTKSTDYKFRVRMMDKSGKYDTNINDKNQKTLDYSNEFSVQLTANEYLDTGISADLSGSGDFSLSAWFKGTNAGYLIAQSYSVGSYSSDFIFGGTGTSLFWMRNVTLGTKSDVEDGEWHHIVFTWNRTTETYKGYLDGVSLGESTVVSGYGGAGTNLMIGVRGDGTTSFAEGLVDEVTIYSSQIGRVEVTALFNMGVAKTPSTTNLLSYWSMGDYGSDSSTSIKDKQSTNDISPVGMSQANFVLDSAN